MSGNTRKYVLTGLMTALVFVLTFLVKIPVPYTSGYIHLGDSMIYLSVIVLGPFYGAFASGVGSMLSDILGGYAQYAIPTLVIKSLMALIMGLVLSGKTRRASVTSIVSAFLVWVAFSAGTMLYLQGQIQRIGESKLVTDIAGPTADAATIKSTTDVLHLLPLYFIVGVAATIAIFSIAFYFFSKRDGNQVFTVRAIVGMTAAGMCMVMGYFVVESFMYSPVAAIFSVPMNMVQFFGGVTAASIFAPAVKRASLVFER
ncbi:MAG: ECF transporter S component [Clostridia bacterium]|nr:ECF transporter S component [Clostridia bacterium]